jgi:hypothetical protein
VSGDIVERLVERHDEEVFIGNADAASLTATAIDEIERLRALVDSVLACDGSDRTTHVTVEIPFDLYHELEEAHRG